VPPAPGTPPRVHVKFVTDDNDLGDFVRVTWALDPTLTTNEQAMAELRQESFALLQAIQAANLPGDDPIVLRATLPDADGVEQRVARLVYERDTLDAIDFATLDPLDLFGLADDIEITDPLPVPIPTTTTTSTT
jgi:hypothetical protein